MQGRNNRHLYARDLCCDCIPSKAREHTLPIAGLRMRMSQQLPTLEACNICLDILDLILQMPRHLLAQGRAI